MTVNDATTTRARRQVDVWADQPHYLDHVAPIWLALPADVRGFFLVPNRLLPATKAKGIEATPLGSLSGTTLRWSRNAMLVCAWGGVLRWRASKRPLILLNHGVGQTHIGGHPSYSGGAGRDRIDLFLEPGPHAAEATRASLPDARVAEVGCAKLDRWHDGTLTAAENSEPVVAFSTHWNCRVVPEANASWPVYKESLLALKGRYQVIAHAHPLIAQTVRADAEAAGVEFVEAFDEVLERADLYLSDCSSTLYEFASTGRPVLCLNIDAYRRDVHHGLRFWDAVPGIQCDSPDELVNKIEEALADAAPARALRAHALRRAYAACDGQSAARAAAAVVGFCEALGK
jgi:hypothetical protein